MRTTAIDAGIVLVALVIFASHCDGRAGDPRPDGTNSMKAEAGVGVVLGEPQWFSNIRHERLVRATVSITNMSDRSFWIMSRGTNEFVHDYERRLSDPDRWETVQYFCGTGTYPHEIRPGASFVTRKVFLDPKDIGSEVRLRIRFYGRFASPGPNAPFFAGLRDPEEFLSNTVHVRNDPLSTQPGGAANRSQPVAPQGNRTPMAAGSGR